MATRRYSVNKEDAANVVTEAAGAAVVTKEMEFTVDLATVTSREQVILALEKIKTWIMVGNWPPA